MLHEPEIAGASDPVPTYGRRDLRHLCRWVQPAFPGAHGKICCTAQFPVAHLSPATDPPKVVARLKCPARSRDGALFFSGELLLVSPDAIAGNSGNVPARDSKVAQLPVRVCLQFLADLNVPAAAAAPADREVCRWSKD